MGVQTKSRPRGGGWSIPTAKDGAAKPSDAPTFTAATPFWRPHQIFQPEWIATRPPNIGSALA